MAKKRKDLPKPETAKNVDGANEGSSSSTVFKSLFGGVTGHDSESNSLFSENNPFRRKLMEGRLQNHKLDLGVGPVGDKDTREGDVGDSDLLEMRRKNKNQPGDAKRERFDHETDSVERKKKLKGSHLKIKEKDGNSEIEADEKEIEKKTKKKRKREEVEAEYETKHYGVSPEIKENTGKTVVLGEKRKKIDNPEDTMVSKEGFDDESKLLRTVFVGNLPLKMKKKEILKEFEKFGEIESVRIRSVPIIDGKIPRKGAIIKKRINESVDSVHAYIVFKAEESAQASLTYNMSVVGGNHIRVDRACPPRKKQKGDNLALYDKQRTIFVGNLPFDVKDEEIYKLLSGLKNFETSIEAVRVIRDPGSSLGKGIAYVLFKTTDAANMIVKKRNLKIRDRELRLSHAKVVSSIKRKRSSEAETNSPSAKKSPSAFRSPNSVNTSKSKTDLSYQGLRASKSSGQKKAHTKNPSLGRSKPPSATDQKIRQNKRPSVAARKERTLQVANASQLAGSKRKFSNRTPQSSGQKKKPRKFQRSH